MPSYTVLTLAALTAVAQAITITSPSTSTVWDSSESNTITWTSVATDPETVDIYLAHQASQPTLNDLLFSGVAVSQGSVDVSGLQLPTGSAYQINFVKPDNEDQIYAQSNQFNVTGTAASATSTLAGYTGPTYTPTASSTSTSSVESSTVSGTLTSSASSATGATTLTTSTGSSTTSTGTVTSSSSSSATGTSGSSTGSSTGTATSSSASATATGNSAAGVAASAPLAALVFGAVAMFA